MIHPMSNLIATAQIRGGDLIRVEMDDNGSALSFFKVAEDMPASEMVKLVDTAIIPPLSVFTAETYAEVPRVANAKGNRR
jgi:hypothetical protein